MRTNQLITATNVIILLNLIMFGVQHIVEYGTVRFGLNIFFFKYDLYYQLLSTMFVHSGIFHILMNMFVLYQFGSMIEQAIGVKRYLFIYFVGGVLTSALSLFYMDVTGDWANLVGASGAICVLLGWFALRDAYQRKGIIIWVLLISFAPLLLGFPIAWYAHIIGFILGWILGYFI